MEQLRGVSEALVWTAAQMCRGLGRLAGRRASKSATWVVGSAVTENPVLFTKGSSLVLA